MSRQIICAILFCIDLVLIMLSMLNPHIWIPLAIIAIALVFGFNGGDGGDDHFVWIINK